MIFGKTRSDPKYLLDSLIYLAESQAPYIHVILSYVVSITLYITQPLVRILLWIINPSVSMISFAHVFIAQWSDTVPSRNVWFQVRIHLTLFHFNTSLPCGPSISDCTYVVPDLNGANVQMIWVRAVIYPPLPPTNFRVSHPNQYLYLHFSNQWFREPPSIFSTVTCGERSRHSLNTLN